jgi:hypothetical protein
MQTVRISTTAVFSKCEEAIFIKARDTQYSIIVTIEPSLYQTIILRLEGMVLAQDRSSTWRMLTSSTTQLMKMERLQGIPSSEVTFNNGYVCVNTRCITGPVTFRLKLESKRYIEQLGDAQPNVRTLYRIIAIGTTLDAQVEQITTNGVIFQRIARDVTGVDKKFASEIATQFETGVACEQGETYSQRRKRITKHFNNYPSDSIDVIALELGVAPTPRRLELKRRHSEVALCSTPDSSCMQKNKRMLLSNESEERREAVYSLPLIELPTLISNQMYTEDADDFFAHATSFLENLY